MIVNNVTDKKFFHNLRNLPFIERIILYGSRARGDFQKKSDIDIAIDCPNASNADWLTISNIIDSADTLLTIDCVRFDALDDNDPFKQAIIKDGVELFNRRKQ